MAFEGDLSNYAAPDLEVDQVGALIRKARELLSDPQAWCKCEFSKGDAYCIIGAVNEAGEQFDFHTGGALDRLESMLPEWAGLRWGKITAFNDNPTTTHADVLALLDRAAGQVA